MKIARIDISSTKGRATIFRSGSDIVINITRLVGRDDSWVVPARATAAADRRAAARRLQTTLDGVYGTRGDVAEYERVIETFAD
jgi:hypothetical protein